MIFIFDSTLALSNESLSSSQIYNPFENISLDLNGYLITDFKKVGSDQKEYGSRFEANLSKKINDNFLGYLEIAFDKDLEGEREGRVDDTLLGLNFDLTKFNYNDVEFELFGKSKTTIATSEESRENSSLRFSQEIESGLKAPVFKNVHEFLPKLSVSLGYKKNIHEFKTHRNGESNISSSLFQKVSLTFSFKEDVSFGSSLKFTTPRTYEGETLTTKTLATHYISAGLTKNINLALIFLNSADILSTDRSETDITYFDKDESTLLFNIAISI